MTGAETELLLALFALYAYECLFWLSPDEQAFTRSEDGWRSHPLTAQSFTLLGRRAVLADPLLLRPGFLRTADAQPPSAQQLSRAAEDLDDLSLLRTQCRLQAVLLLLVLPALVWTHRLTPWWPEYTGLLVFNHGLLCYWLIRALRIVPTAARRKLFTPALLNPLGAIRVLDPLAQALYESEPAPAGKKG